MFAVLKNASCTSNSVGQKYCEKYLKNDLFSDEVCVCDVDADADMGIY